MTKINMNSNTNYLYAKPDYIEELDLKVIAPGTIEKFWFHIVTDGMGRPVYLPIIVARGKEDGDVLGITAAVHGNELNGIPVIQRLFKEPKR